MNAATLQPAPLARADARMAEAWQLYDLGFRSAAAATSRIAIEYAISDRIQAAGIECERSAIKDQARALQHATSMNLANRKRIVDLFFDLSQYVHGRNRDEKGVHRLMPRAEELLAIIATC